MGEASTSGAVYSWAAHRVGFYVETLGRHLARIEEGGALASVLEHAMYCGMSLARVGLDFRMLLAPVFEACLLDLFARAAQVGRMWLCNPHRPQNGRGVRWGS